jgi:hypothetical protein
MTPIDVHPKEGISIHVPPVRIPDLHFPAGDAHGDFSSGPFIRGLISQMEMPWAQGSMADRESRWKSGMDCVIG